MIYRLQLQKDNAAYYVLDCYLNSRNKELPEAVKHLMDCSERLREYHRKEVMLE